MAGAGADFFMTHLDDAFFMEDGTKQIVHDTDGHSTLVKGFAQWQHRFSDRLIITPGIYTQFYTFTGDFSAEPRFGLRWTLNERSSASFGTGLHSQLQPRLVNFYMDDDGRLPNAKLGMSRSWQTVAGYDLKITDGMRLKTEAYYQYLYHIPVTREVPQESILNLGDDAFNDWNKAFVNDGVGRNYGVELTVEKFFERNWYFLMTGSLYDAKYTDYEGVAHRCKFAGNFSLNVVAGYEWQLGKTLLLSVNAKTVYMGAKRYIPLRAETTHSEPDFDWSQTYTQRLPYFFRCDLNVNMKQNFKRVTLEWFFELFNLTDRKNIWQQFYNTKRQEYEYMYHFRFMPMGGFKVYF
jgi:outer membrane receptor protein involved in Fe transport